MYGYISQKALSSLTATGKYRTFASIAVCYVRLLSHINFVLAKCSKTVQFVFTLNISLFPWHQMGNKSHTR